ncbi:MAG: adenosine kinase [Alphaproteobacteria bacterium]|nr:adenosine kinase [Alphaproteobacteria bacterium]
MTAYAYDVVAVGNAIVDVLAQAPDAFLQQHDITRGAMTLIDEDRALYLTGLLSNAVLAAGGSAANTVTGIASLGGTAGYIGKVSDDALGAQFTTAFRAAGVAFDTTPRSGPPGTARSIIIVSPDGQRSMNTYLGASTLLEPADIDAALIRAGAITFLEGYLFDRDEAKAAFVHAAEIAKAAERRVALTLSDTFCVDRHRQSFRHLVAGHVDILFANENELMSLYETASLDEAVSAARRDCPIVAVTRSAEGSLVAAHGEILPVKAAPVAKVVDTTGAGDLYAAGFLYGLARGRDLVTCGRLGSLAAGEVISHMGPRPETSLKALARSAGLEH